MTIAAIYARISSDPKATELGVTRQLKDCRELVKRLGWTVGKEYVDNDVSATNGKARPQYELMMAALRRRDLQALAAYDIDRLTRQPRELEDIIDLAEKQGVELATCSGEINLTNDNGILTARIKGILANSETRQISKRVKRKMAERAQAGLPHGRCAYGWRREYSYNAAGLVSGSVDVLDEPAAQLLRDAAARLLAGESLNAIVASLVASDAPRPTKAVWSATGLRTLLLRERNAGLIIHHEEVIGTGVWPAIYDKGTHDRVVALLTDPSRRTSPGNNVKHLLSGIVRCGVCDGPMRVLTAGNGRWRTKDTMVCSQEYHVRRLREPIEQLVVENVVRRLAQPDAAALFTQADDQTAAKARALAETLRARLDLASDSYAEGTIDARQLHRITGKLRPEIDAAQQAARDCSTTPDLMDLARPDIADIWDDLPLGRQRAAIDALMGIRVMRLVTRGGQDFDPASIEITWKAPVG